VVIFLCGVLVGRGVRAEAIGSDEAIAAAASVPAPSPVDAVPAEPVPQEPPVPSPEADLTYHQRLQNERTPPEEFKPRAEEPKKRPEPAKTAVTPPPAARQTGTAGQGARPGTWAVQVVSLSDRSAANQIVQRLTNKGYPAFLVPPSAGAPSQLYKVQVGRYDDRREAQRISTRLKQEERFDPWIVR
jgi:DedD protein